ASTPNVQPTGEPGFSTGIEEAKQTGSDISAPTIMTLDSPPRPQGQQPPPAATSLAQPMPPPPPPQQSAPPMATIATNPNAGATGGFASSAPASPPPQQQYQQQQQHAFAPSAPTPSYTPAPPQVAAKKGSPMVPIIIGVLLLFLIVGGVGGFFIWRSMSSSGETANTNTNGNTNANANTNTNTNNGTTGAAAEAMQYWLELDGAKPARVAAVVPLASGQSFRFHITPQEDGYLYIVGPGEDNVPLTFLTAQPLAGTGVKNNSVKANQDYAFPRAGGQIEWITLDKNPGTEFYTIIFSKTPLTALSFLNEEANHPLTSSQQSAWQAFLSEHKANAPATNVMDENSAEPYVSVKSPQAKGDDDPLVFDVRIEHK
ncbi:MAG: DUF4384 domain-containing protein, partial [Acidobacteria bacterium]|nr:DUF4384 domain-containing protein [Acidobacteriota bacterium]